MSDETPTTDSAPTPEPGTGSEAAPESGVPTDAWNEVVARMGDLGAAISAWARAAANDPQNKQRLAQVRAGVDEMARQADDALGKVASSDLGQQVSQGAQQAGDALTDAAQQVSEAAAPHVATALSGLAGMFGRAAAKVDEAVSKERPADAPSGAAPASTTTDEQSDGGEAP